MLLDAADDAWESSSSFWLFHEYEQDFLLSTSRNFYLFVCVISQKDLEVCDIGFDVFCMNLKLSVLIG